MHERRWSRRTILSSVGVLALAGLTPRSAVAEPPVTEDQAASRAAVDRAASGKLPSKADVVAEFAGRRPTAFGMFLPGMVTHGRRRVALTFDACGGSRGSGYDAKLISTLRRAKVPATLFLNARWIAAHPKLASDLADDPLFEIGNHGWQHRPLTVRGQVAYGIAGTRSVAEAYDEIVRGLDAVAELTGRRPLWFRPGTAWADDVGVAIARRLGVRVVSFSINADAGATASTSEVVAELRKARRKAIVIGHLNQPHGRTAEGLAKALPRMKRDGRHFATLSKALA